MPTEIGDAVHRLLELVDLAAPAPPEAADLEERVRGWYPAVSGRRAVARSASSSARTWARRSPRGSPGFAAPGRSDPFAFELDGVLVNGRLDVLWIDGDRALVLDYKTNALHGRDPAEIVDGAST